MEHVPVCNNREKASDVHEISSIQAQSATLARGSTRSLTRLDRKPGMNYAWSRLTKLATMPEAIYNLYEAKSSLSRLVERAAAGEEIIIAKAGKPMAKLTPVSKPRRRKPGGWKGRIRIAKNFDAPLPDEIQRAFQGRS